LRRHRIARALALTRGLVSYRPAVAMAVAATVTQGLACTVVALLWPAAAVAYTSAHLSRRYDQLVRDERAGRGGESTVMGKALTMVCRR
jgi:hypothetical protein